MYTIKEYLILISITVLVCSLVLIRWRWMSTKNPKEYFWLGVGLYVVYTVLMCVMFYLTPGLAASMVEGGTITGKTVQEAAAFLSVLFFALINTVILVFVIVYHCGPKRREMSEMDRLKLNDL